MSKNDDAGLALLQAVIACAHSITSNEIILRRANTRGGNALSQLQERLAAALASPTPRREAGGERVTDTSNAQHIIDTYGRGTPVDDLSLVLFEAWVKADPASGPAQHPASYLATFADMARAALGFKAALSAPSMPDAEPVASDWVLVPREPTEAMMAGAAQADIANEDERGFVFDMWNAMLAAAPQHEGVKDNELRRAANALLNNLWGGVVTGIKTHKENWSEMERLFPGAERLHEAMQSPSQPAKDAEAEEAYEIGKREGYEDAVQDIDQMTGGDGEYRYCTDHDPDRHCPDAATMKSKVSSRFEDAEFRAEAAEASLAKAAEALERLDAYWTESFPEGPDGNPEWLGGIGRLSETTIEVWREIRAALHGEDERG